VLEKVERALDLVARLVEVLVVRQRLDAVGLRRDDRLATDARQRSRIALES
jgi:hypothetical protein